MSARKPPARPARTSLSAYDHARIESVIAELEHYGLLVDPGGRMPNRNTLSCDLFDAAATLRTVLIWEACYVRQSEDA